MISGAHVIIYSKDVQADLAFFRDVLKLANVDVGNGWLIFKLPSSELAIHPTPEEEKHELYLLADDIDEFIRQMAAAGVECSPVQRQRWGILTELTLPGGGRVGVYQPLHARP